MDYGSQSIRRANYRGANRLGPDLEFDNMRIVLVAPDIPDYGLEYARMLSATCDVLLFIPDKFRSTGYPPMNVRLEVRWMPWPRQRSLGNIPFIFRLARQIRQWRPDAVHILDANHVWLNPLRLLLGSIPIVTTIHDVYVHPGDTGTGKVPRGFIKSLVRRSRAIVVHGEKLRADAATELPIDPNRIFVFPHPPLWRYAKLARQSGLEKPGDDQFRIVFFGRINEYKGLRYLIEAAPSVVAKVPNARFVIAGRGDDLSIYHQLMVDPSCFEIHNRFISETDAAKIFTDADLMVLPYTEASQSGVLLIALTFELPIVATDVGEMGQIVRSAGMGSVVAPRDPAALASAIVEVACNRDKRDTFRKNMRHLIDGELSDSQLATRALAMYERILRTKTSDTD